MAILTADDAAIYFPSLGLSGDALDGALLAAQRLAESIKGAGRSLELTAYTEIKKVNRNLQTVQLSYWPIAASPAPTIETRYANITDRHHRGSGTGKWYAREADTYILDATGKLNLAVTEADEDFQRLGAFHATEVRATYTAGFDFTDDNYTVQQIKSAVAAIALQQNADLYRSGIEESEVVDKVRVRFSSGATKSEDFSMNGLGYRDALQYLQKFRPRAYL